MFDTFKIPQGSIASRIRKNVKARQNLKKKWDKHCKWGAESDETRELSTYGVAGTVTFSSDSDQTEDNFVRLLDEGVVVEGDGSPYAVIAKGTLKTWFDELPSNFEGYINKDHISGLGLGAFKKEDLKLVKGENGRYGIDVNVKLDKELYATKDLLKQNNRKALSAEFFYEADEYVKASAVTGEDYPDWYLIPKIDAVQIVGYGVVEAPKNANSYDEDLLEKASDDERTRTDMSKLKTEGAVEELEVAIEAEAQAQTENFEAETEAEVEATEVEAEVETDTETEAETETQTATDAEDKVEAQVEQLKAQFEAFKTEIAEKDAKIAELEAKIAESKVKKDNFETKLASLLNFASTDDPTAEESATPTSKTDAKDDYTAALEDAFKGL